MVEAFSQMWGVLEATGLLLVAFHVGNEVVRPDELWGVRVTMDFYLHSPDVVCRSLDVAGFSVEDIAESEPYPEVDTKVDARTSLDANAHSHRPRKVISQRTRGIIPYCSNRHPRR